MNDRTTLEWRWNLDIDTEDDPDLERSLVSIYLDGNASYAKTWWLTAEGGRGNKKLLYNMEDCVDVCGKCVENIDLKKILHRGTEKEEEEFITLITEKILSPLEPAVCWAGLRSFARFVLVDCRDRLNDKLSILDKKCSKSFSVGVGVFIHLSLILTVNDLMRSFEECLGRRRRDDGFDFYSPSSPMPLPVIVPDAYDYFRLGGDEEEGEEEKTCAICFENFGPSSSEFTMVRLQCLDELLPGPEEHWHKAARGNGAMLLPCDHIFHVNCISNWLLRSPPLCHTCPLCRFHVPPRPLVLFLLHLFPLKVMSSNFEYVKNYV
ncbi:unnamed protein product [Cuscuta europaea]|uniref:RING-type domain-containing protein n=1 Tax=Cuscuta europaea TaxID=41803 RepID=A0A9P1EHE9_CUSEU|nr:unnamed protein product [Cuscuta europaea]